MKKFIVLVALVIMGAFAWGIGSKLSPDAIGMGLGVLLGVLAGVPAALLLMVSNRQRGRQDDEEAPHNMRQLPPGMAGYPPQAPVIVLAGHGMAAPPQQQSPYGPQAGYPALPGPQAGGVEMAAEERRFKVVGEQEGWVDEW